MVGLEVCVDNPESLARAIAGGADRIELCAALTLGGLTSSPGLMELAAAAPIPVYAMIRPRAGDFRYSPSEVAAMRADIRAARAAGLAGVVLGAATREERLDRELLALLLAQADGMGATLHRVIDTLPDPFQALEDAIALGFERILTSGGRATAEEGAETIAALARQSTGRIVIMAGGGVRSANAVDLLQRTGADELHGSCSVPSRATAGSSRTFQHGDSQLTDPDEVRALKSHIARYEVKSERHSRSTEDRPTSGVIKRPDLARMR